MGPSNYIVDSPIPYLIITVEQLQSWNFQTDRHHPRYTCPRHANTA